MNSGIKLIVGLGNPGQEYARNRHNIGFLCIDKLAKAYKISLNQKKNRAISGKGIILDKEFILAKPSTYMNNSGLAVKLLMKNYGVDLSGLLVVYDDMDLPVGKIRLRPQGSAGGHHGMESIIESLGDSSFARLRIGISKPVEQEGVSFVLSDFLPEEKEIIEKILDKIVELFPVFLKGGMSQAMNKFNRFLDLVPSSELDERPLKAEQ